LIRFNRGLPGIVLLVEAKAQTPTGRILLEIDGSEPAIFLDVVVQLLLSRGPDERTWLDDWYDEVEIMQILIGRGFGSCDRNAVRGL